MALMGRKRGPGGGGGRSGGGKGATVLVAVVAVAATIVATPLAGAAVGSTLLGSTAAASVATGALSGAAAGAAAGATAASLSGGNLGEGALQGAAVGGAGGAVGGTVTAALPAGTPAFAAQAASGAARGATTSAITGQDVGTGALAGGVAGGVAGATGTALQDVVPREVLPAATGAASGAAASAVRGGDIAAGAMQGAAGGALSSALQPVSDAVRSAIGGQPQQPGVGGSPQPFTQEVVPGGEGPARILAPGEQLLSAPVGVVTVPEGTQFPGPPVDLPQVPPYDPTALLPMPEPSGQVIEITEPRGTGQQAAAPQTPPGTLDPTTAAIIDLTGIGAQRPTPTAAATRPTTQAAPSQRATETAAAPSTQPDVYALGPDAESLDPTTAAILDMLALTPGPYGIAQPSGRAPTTAGFTQPRPAPVGQTFALGGEGGGRGDSLGGRGTTSGGGRTEGTGTGTEGTGTGGFGPGTGSAPPFYSNVGTASSSDRALLAGLYGNMPSMGYGLRVPRGDAAGGDLEVEPGKERGKRTPVWNISSLRERGDEEAA